jgi:muramoyltetrapeptide carboxypeptidase
MGPFMPNEDIESGEEKRIRIPERLSPGECIGIVAPASAFDTAKFERGIELITSMGFRVDIPQGLLDPKGYLSASDEIRAMHINRYFADPGIKAIFCARGGYGSVRALEWLDWDTICKNPKIFVGYSDITVLLSAFYVKCRFAVFHGPMAVTLADSDEDSKTALLTALTCPNPYQFSLEDCRILKPGAAAGPVIGGNLASLCHLMGTAYAPQTKKHIVFLEDRGEALYRIDRMLKHLALAGYFKDISGLVLGSFAECGDYREIEKLALDVLGHRDVPLVSGLNAGHCGRNITIPMGVPAILDTDRRMLSFNFG